jgi:hypothetical protein
MLTVLGNPRRTCQGLDRREWLQVGGAGLFGVHAALAQAAESAGNNSTGGKAKAVLFVFLYGGPSQLDTFDMKPDIPRAYGGPFRPIDAVTPGLRICEHLPRLAARSDRYATIRTVTHPQNDHNGTHFIQTGHTIPPANRGAANVAATNVDWPAFGSVISYLDHRASPTGQLDFPPYIYLPQRLGHYAGYDINGQYAGWLGKAYDPMATAIPKQHPQDNPFFRDCTDKELDFRLTGLDPLPGITLDRLNTRQRLLTQLESRRRELDSSPATRTYTAQQQQALGLIHSSDIARAFDIRQEPDKLRDTYGRNLFGQSLVMARRLIESGARFVTVGWDMTVRGDDTTSWDSHRQLTRINRDHLLPGLDVGLSALLDDMGQTGLLDEVLVITGGEMGRTPKFENRGSQDGRDHWSYCFPMLLAGAGVQGGLIHGVSDKHSAYPAELPVTPGDLAATVYHSLGISPDTRIPDAQDRPTPLVEKGRPLTRLFG